MANSQYVSQETFNTVLNLLKENREILRDQLESLSTKVDNVSSQLTTGIEQITRRQDIANGRMNTAEQAIEDIKSEVDEILNEGCHQKAKHVEAMATLAAVGVVDSTENDTAERVSLVSAPTRKKIIIRTGIASGLIGLGMILPDILRGIHALLDHIGK